MSNEEKIIREFEAELVRIIREDHKTQLSIVNVKITRHKDETKIGTHVVCKGRMPNKTIGSIYFINGEAVYNKAWSKWEIKVNKWSEIKCSAVQGIKSFLIREAHGIGQVKAVSLVDNFKEQTFNVVLDEPQLVIEKRILNKKELLELQNFLKSEGKQKRYVKSILYGLNLNYSLINKLLEYFGDTYKLLDKLKDEVFDLTKLHGVGFQTVCRIADALGIPKDREDRIRAGICFCLKNLCDTKGHTCVPHDLLISEATHALQVRKDIIVNQMKHMIDINELATDKSEVGDFINFFPLEIQDELMELY